MIVTILILRLIIYWYGFAYKYSLAIANTQLFLLEKWVKKYSGFSLRFC